MFFIKTNKKIQTSKAFTVVELIVVIGIFVLMTTITSFKYNKFIKQSQISELAHDIALTIRQMQVYGISASGKLIANENFEGTEDTFFDATSGQVRDITQDRSVRGVSIYGPEKKIILFEDANRNHVYDDGTDVVIDERDIRYNVHIGFILCDADGNCNKTESGRLDISFQRPYPDATMYFTDGASHSPVDHAQIMVMASGVKAKSISVNAIGNIVLE